LPGAPCLITAPTISKCAHSVYYPDHFREKEIPNPGCVFCTPPDLDFDAQEQAAKNFVLPARCCNSLENDPERLYATTPPGACACGCRIHTVDEKGRWFCPDCGAQIRNVPKHLRAKERDADEVHC